MLVRERKNHLGVFIEEPMILFKSLMFQLKCLRDSYYPGIIDTINHNNSIWVSGESLLHGSSPLYARATFSLVRDPFMHTFLHVMQFSKLKFLSKLLMKIRYCEEFDGLNDTGMLKYSSCSHASVCGQILTIKRDP